jgi:hypothetical protein
MEEYLEPIPETRPPQPTGSIHLPFALLAIAVCIFLFAQISNLGQASRSIAWQSANLDRQLVSLADQEKRFSELIKQRETLVEQSQQVQTRYTDMLNDLLALSESDEDALAIVEKYRIQRQKNNNAAAAPESTAKPATDSQTQP